MTILLVIILYILCGFLVSLILDRQDEYNPYRGSEAVLICTFWPFVVFAWVFEVISKLNRKTT